MIPDDGNPARRGYVARGNGSPDAVLDTNGRALVPAMPEPAHLTPARAGDAHGVYDTGRVEGMSGRANLRADRIGRVRTGA